MYGGEFGMLFSGSRWLQTPKRALRMSFGLDTFKTHSLFAPRIGPSIYHYTTLAGAVGIIETKSLWVTKIQYLNDSRELIHAIELVGAAFREFEKSKLTVGALKMLEGLINGLSGAKNINICVASFCEDRDLLSQWRGYAPSAQGIALGFSSRALEQRLQKLGWHLYRCVYDPIEQRRILNELLDQYVTHVESTSPDEIAARFNAQFLTIAPILKSPAFKEEREWRIVSLPISFKDEVYDARVVGTRLTPYVKLQFELNFEGVYDFVSDVCVGPAVNQFQTVDAMGVLLRKHKMSAGVVHLSQVPFRT
jgi:hypothetical protein